MVDSFSASRKEATPSFDLASIQQTLGFLIKSLRRYVSGDEAWPESLCRFNDFSRMLAPEPFWGRRQAGSCSPSDPCPAHRIWEIQEVVLPSTSRFVAAVCLTRTESDLDLERVGQALWLALLIDFRVTLRSLYAWSFIASSTERWPHSSPILAEAATQAGCCLAQYIRHASALMVSR